jgi:hypothetical protein
MRLTTVLRPFVVGAAAVAMFAMGACNKSAPATPPPAPSAPAQPAAQTPPPSPPAQVTPPPAQPPAATPPAGAQPAGAPAGAPAPGAAGGRGGRGTPPPPPEPPPAVMPPPVAPIVSGTAPSPDPRVGLKAGAWDAGQAAWNMKLISTTPPGPKVLGATHSDLAFSDKYVIQGNYNGFEIYDISNVNKPVLVNQYLCPASQNDVSVYKHLLFMSSESTSSRRDCGFGGFQGVAAGEAVPDRVRGIRIFDIKDPRNPKLVKSVETCRGSHTHTVVTQPGDKDNVYVYIQGTSGVRPEAEVPGCKDTGADAADPNNARFRLEVIKIPLADPSKAEITNAARVFQNLPVAPRNPERDAAGRRGGQPPAAGAAGAPPAGTPPAGATPPPVVAGGGAAAGGAAAGRGGAAPAGPGRGGRGNAPPTGPNQCHDITVYPDVGLAGGACAGLGLLLDIREATHPIRIDFVGDPNMSFWHSATFSNDGKKILFSDEWGGGSAPRCRATDKLEWGANAIFTIENNKMVFKSYYKMPAAQTDQENCVAHNGSLLPIPGREVMVQAFYQGGLTVFDWTDPAKPYEIAFFDRGPINAERLVSGGSWSAYWYNGYIVSSEIFRGLDIFEMVANPNLTQNEIDAMNTVKLDYWNPQEQRKFVWPPSFALARAYVDQLERSKGLSPARLTAVRNALAAAEKANGGARRTGLTTLATSLDADISGSSDANKVRMLQTAITDLSK